MSDPRHGTGRSSLPPRPAAVAPVSVAALQQLLGVTGAGGDITVTGATHDSRAVRPGDLYAALPGSRVHGARHAGQALDAGAVAVLTDPRGASLVGELPTGVALLAVDDPRACLGEVAATVYGHPARDLLVLGVTGTNGKTTTAYLLEAGLRAAGRRTGLVGTVETRVGDEAVPSTRTTPESTDLQALLAVMRERGVTAVATEISSHALALGRVDGLVCDVAGFTNLSQDHLDYHGDLENYFATKASLFTPARAKQGVVTLGDEWARQLPGRAHAAGLPMTTVAVEPEAPDAQHVAEADWRVEKVVPSTDGSRFVLVGADGSRTDASVRLPARFNVANAALALVMLVAAGVDPAAAVRGVADCEGVPGRMEPVRAGQQFAALVDYAHTPDALRTLLTSLREVTEGRLIVVVGAGGDRDRSKRPLMGEVCARLADVVVLTNDNPRSEDPYAIIEAVRDGAMQVPAEERAELEVVPDRAAAIDLAVGHAQAGDTVVVAGKGHEQGQELADGTVPFDDRDALGDALRRILL